MNKSWEKKYESVPKGLIEELAELRHNQMRSWSREMIKLLSKYQYEHKNLDDYADEVNKLCGNNWRDYDKLDDIYKAQSRIFALAIVDIIRKYYKFQQ